MLMRWLGRAGLLVAMTHAAGAADQPVAIRFAALVGDQPFVCGHGYDGVGSAGSRITPGDFRLFVSGLRLIGADGKPVAIALEQDGQWQQRDLALLDFEDKTGPCANGTVDMRDQVRGTVPAGNYRGLVFTLGVPADLNHQDATIAASPLNLTSMFWNWQGGYKFLRIDLTGGGAAPAMKPMAAGLGSTGCDTGPRGATGPGLPVCRNPNRAEIALADFDPARDVVAIDLKALLKDTDVATNQPQTAPGCMSEPFDGDCAGVMANLGLPFQDRSAAAQSVFRIK